MKKLITLFFAIGIFFPVVAEAKLKCKSKGGITVCRLSKPKKCTKRRPCIPKGYYRPNPPIFTPMK